MTAVEEVVENAQILKIVSKECAQEDRLQLALVHQFLILKFVLVIMMG
jgi:hypothetical protein